MDGADRIISIEGLDFDAETIPGSELLKQIEVDGMRDRRFLPIRKDGKGGVFEYSPFRDHWNMSRKDVWYSTLKLNGLVVGLAELLWDERNPKHVTLNTISIDKHLKGLKRDGSEEEKKMMLAEQLLAEVFKFAKPHYAEIYIRGYTDEGAERLPRILVRLSHKTGLKVR